ncbi:MAG: ABC transporter permease [Pirellulaceae bacterium]|jgi:putative ABC transport system permease protein|nr:ABC transporter permease [Pirellulaceae bacterium]
MWSVAIKTLLADRGKLCTALVGVVFSIVLVDVQGGLFLGLIRKAGMLVDYGDADIWVGHHRIHNVDFPRDIPRRWVHRVRAVPGVQDARPYMLGFTEMTLPGGGFETVLVVGVDRASRLGSAWNYRDGTPESILANDGIVVDVCEGDKLDDPAVGELREVGRTRARVVARTEGIMNFLVTPYVFTTYDRALRFLRKPADRCSYILVQLAPGADRQRVCAAIKERLPDAEAFERDEYSRVSVDFWMTRTGLGISFGAATLLGLFVGLVMVAQTLYALVLDRLPEYGTLKAMGATEAQVYGLLVSQATALALLGSAIGLAVVYVVQEQFSSPKAPIIVPWWLSLGSCALVLIICLVSSVLPYLRIRRVDPVMVLSQ